MSSLDGEADSETDVKPDNILVNYRQGGSSEGQETGIRLADVQVADLGSTVHVDSQGAKDGYIIGVAIFRSAVASMQLRWDTETDIWSFGTTINSLIYGGDFHNYAPKVPFDHPECQLEVIMRMEAIFGPFPQSYTKIGDAGTFVILDEIMDRVHKTGAHKPFQHVTESEVVKEDKQFLLQIVKLDPRDRPSAAELLENKQFSQDTK